jgi:hypothetical protein
MRRARCHCGLSKCRAGSIALQSKPCRRARFADLPASALIGVSSFAWLHMLLEIQTEAMVAK